LSQISNSQEFEFGLFVSLSTILVRTD